MSTTIQTKTQYTPEDLLAMPDGRNYELVGGQLVERKMGMESGWVGTRLSGVLDRFREEHGIGWAVNAENEVYRVDGSVDHLREDGVLSGEDIIPGFRCPLREILPQREPLPEVEQSPKGPNGSQ